MIPSKDFDLSSPDLDEDLPPSRRDTSKVPLSEVLEALKLKKVSEEDLKDLKERSNAD